MLSVALTGNIGAGKSTVAELFRRWGADHHRCRPAGARAPGTGPASFPGDRSSVRAELIAPDGTLDRAGLRARVLADPAALADLNRIVHPEVRRRRQELLAEARARGDRIVVSDIPLLFEADDPAASTRWCWWTHRSRFGGPVCSPPVRWPGGGRPADGRADCRSPQAGAERLRDRQRRRSSPLSSGGPPVWQALLRSRLTSPAGPPILPRATPSGERGCQTYRRTWSIPRNTSTSPGPTIPRVVALASPTTRRASLATWSSSPSQAGRPPDAHQAFGTIEAVKAVSELYSPVAGEVAEINAALEADPAVVNRDPYGDGWMVKLRLQSRRDSRV